MSKRHLSHGAILSCLLLGLGSRGDAQPSYISVTTLPVPAACPPPPSSPVAINIGQTQQFIATPIYPACVAGPAIANFTWNLGDATIASVDSTGSVKALKSGTTTITATDPSTGRNGSITIHVTPGDLQSIAIDPQPAPIPANTTAQLKVEGTFVVAGQSHTEPIPASSITWVSSSDATATVGSTGLITGVTVGPPVSITAVYSGPNPVPVPSPAIPPAVVSLTITATTPVKPVSVSVQFIGQPRAGDQNVRLIGNPGDVVYLYQFDAGYIPTSHLNACGRDDLNHSTPLMILNSGTAQASFTLSSAAPQTIPLSTPLMINTQLCASSTPKIEAGATAVIPAYSAFQPVADPNAYGRLRTYITAGAAITNQQSASTTSTANVYADLDLDYSWARAGKITVGGKYHRGPGFDTLFSIRLSPIPVAATVNTTPVAGATGTAAISSTSLNVLTSQQSAHIIMGSYLPVVTTRFYNKSNVFTVAPTFRFGFDTLLNPSVSSGASTATGTTTTVLQTGNFSSVYSFYNGGVRLAWEQLARSTDQAPQTWAELNLLVGKYSNLPSYVCASGPGGLDVVAADYKTAPTPALPPSACGTGVYATQHFASRTLLPRLSVTGKAQFPSYPFVLGIDANLAQYTIGNHKEQIDYLNKAGNDIRLYIGVTFNLASLVSKLGMNTF